MKIKITKKDSPFFGKIMNVDMVYYDHEHTGSSDDIYHANLEGKFYKVKSSICEEVKE
jgi:hypothetical protein